LLRNHNWERNVAELKECLYFAVAQATMPSHVITIEDLFVMFPEKQTSFVDEQLFCHFGSLDEATETFQKTYLLYVLKQHEYNLKKISHLLHINISELRATIVRLGINLS
jgi:DNA-binding NtrC family response regulator